MVTTHLIFFQFFPGAAEVVAAAEEVPLLGGKGDNERRRIQQSAKPLGLPPRRKRAPLPIPEPIEQAKAPGPRLDDIDLVVPAQSEPVTFQPIETLSGAQIDAEIGRLLRAQLTSDEEDRLRLLLIAAAS